MKTALFIGRFQPFHKGHLSAVKQILEENDKVLIGIGSSQYSNTKENPFTAEERKEMIKKALDTEGIKDYEIIFVPDIHSDPEWGDYVKKLCPIFDVVYTNSDHTKRCFELAKEKCSVKSIKVEFDISSTEIRKRIKENKEWKEFVPNPVAEEIKRINGVERIKELFS
ncbi:nicotinamide-nucleotide adenylyltransferase [Candidatus Woesearchaeota archaeon]|nr:nicotinamide-nucleotide adenylyltransferase [Candidatus Woesearchaeota archaeon]